MGRTSKTAGHKRLHHSERSDSRCLVYRSRFRKKEVLQRKKAEKRGEKIEYTEKQQQHIDKDATFSVKHGQVHFGYKTHMKLDVGHELIREYEVSTASLHDGEVDLVKAGDISAFRDKGYVGKPISSEVIDKTMKRATKTKKLNGGELKRNKAISRIRAPGERPFSVVKRVFHGGETFVKNITRVSIKEMFKFIAFNLYQLVTLKRRELAKAL